VGACKSKVCCTEDGLTTDTGIILPNKCGTVVADVDAVTVDILSDTSVALAV